MEIGKSSQQGPEEIYKVNDLVLLSTANWRKEYMAAGSGCITKLFPRRDRPYHVVVAFPETSTYHLEVPNALPNFCHTFHTLQLKRYVLNDWTLFPGWDFPHSGTVLLENGREEHVIERILDKQRCGRGWQYLVWWKGYGLGDDEWLPRREIETIVLDEWLRGRGGSGEARA